MRVEDAFRVAVERGKQLGKTVSFERQGKVFWTSVAIQKVEGDFKVYVDEIAEDSMASEEYFRDEVRRFVNLDDAVNYIEGTTSVRAADLKPCKGQKIFNPHLPEPPESTGTEESKVTEET